MIELAAEPLTWSILSDPVLRELHRGCSKYVQGAAETRRYNCWLLEGRGGLIQWLQSMGSGFQSLCGHGSEPDNRKTYSHVCLQLEGMHIVYVYRYICVCMSSASGLLCWEKGKGEVVGGACIWARAVFSACVDLCSQTDVYILCIHIYSASFLTRPGDMGLW